MNVLIISEQPRLIEAVRANLGSSAQIRVAANARDAQDQLFQETIRLVLLDYDVLQHTSSELLVGIDNMVQKEHGFTVLLCRHATPEAVKIRDQFASIRVAIDLSRGRPQFDEKIKSAYDEMRRETDLSISTDRLIRHEIDLAAPDAGSLLDFPVARLLYTVWQRKETGVLKLQYSSHELTFGFLHGDLLQTTDYSARSELLGAFAWSHGKYEFESKDVAGATTPVMEIIAEGCRDHIRQRAITEAMTPIMRRYPVKTNLWEERVDQLGTYDVLIELMNSLDGSTNWETALSALGPRVTDGFRAAYFANQLDLTQTLQQPGIIGVAVQYSREVRRARQAVDQAEIEKTKAFKAASGSGRSEIERDLGVQLGKMRHMSVHEIFGVWEGCGRKVVQDRFYILVKENHPDVYGGNTTGDVRSLAQDIFILIKDAYQVLLGVEKEQKVAPPEPAPAETPRQRIDTPRAHVAVGGPIRGASLEEASEVKVDVKSKMSQLSGFRKKQRHRDRVRSVHERTSSASDEEIEPIEVEPEPEPEPEPDPQLEAQLERQAKLKHLMKRAQDAGHPDVNPSRDHWDKGFHAHKDGRNAEALEHFSRAYALEPEDGPILTFYGYLRFLNHKHDKEIGAEAEELLRKALQSGNRQSAPDACLFLAHVIKGLGREEEALTFYRRALRLNPSSREAEREVRLADMRDPDKKPADNSLFKNLFKK